MSVAGGPPGAERARRAGRSGYWRAWAGPSARGTRRGLEP
jgi:hypothetical protein